MYKAYVSGWYVFHIKEIGKTLGKWNNLSRKKVQIFKSRKTTGLLDAKRQCHCES